MNIEKEVWKDIEDYEGLYEVSNFGNVRSLNYLHTGKIRVLKPGTAGRGYLFVVLCKNGTQKKFYIHRLVMMAFLENPGNLPEVNHKDEDKTNNRVENLEWCTAKYNHDYGTRTERVTKAKSKPVLQFTKEGTFVREWPSTQEAGRNGFNQQHIAYCCRGKRKSHAGFIWKYMK